MCFPSNLGWWSSLKITMEFRGSKRCWYGKQQPGKRQPSKCSPCDPDGSYIYISLYITIYQSNMFNWKQDRTNKSKHCSTLSCLRFFCVGAARHGLPSNLRRRPAFAARSHRRPWRRHQPWPTLKTPCRNSWSCWRWNCFRRMTWYVVTFYGCWCGHLRGEVRGE